MTDRLWLTPQDVARLTGLTASFIRQECHTGLLPASRVRAEGRQRWRWRIHVSHVTAYMQALGYATPQTPYTPQTKTPPR